MHVQTKSDNEYNLINLDREERIFSLAGGLALVVVAIGRISMAAVAMLLAGAYLLYRGLRGHCLVYAALGINKAIDGAGQTAKVVLPSGREVPPEIEADLVTEASQQSFPTSDPPSWTLGRERRAAG